MHKLRSRVRNLLIRERAARQLATARAVTRRFVMARYQRMRGKNVFYPMGWDDNGLPTERRVQNYFHIRCDPHTPYEPGLEVEPASSKQRKKPPRLVSRQNFIEICGGLTAVDEQVFKDLFQSLGLSIDWSLEYATIDERCRARTTTTAHAHRAARRGYAYHLGTDALHHTAHIACIHVTVCPGTGEFFFSS